MDGMISDIEHYFKYIFAKKITLIKFLLERQRSCVKTTIDELKQKFNKLDLRFFSLGQSIDFYRVIDKLESEYKKEILTALNDVLYNPKLIDKIKDKDCYNTSLLRNSEARWIIENREHVLENIDFEGESEFHFKYNKKLPNAIGAHKVEFDFRKKSYLPHRINAIIGKNGTGKTQILSSLAKSLLYNQKKDFIEIPNFSKIIVVSYSAFDDFFNPKNTKDNLDNLQAIDGLEEIEERSKNNSNKLFNYVYCGIRDGERILSIGDIKERLRKSLADIKEKDRLVKWRGILSEIIEPEYDYLLLQVEEELENVILSSGQHVLMSAMTEVIANIEKQSLILFDEPETHLHPNAISNLMRMLNKLLKEFNSYCILSTHSPLIIQEIPSIYTQIFDRNNNLPIISELSNESFGENISNIINEVFNVKNYESNYKSYFLEMVKNMEFDEIIEVFDDQLSFNAMTFLNILEKQKKDGSGE